MKWQQQTCVWIPVALVEMVQRPTMFGGGKEGDTSSALGPARGGRFWRL